MKVRSSYVAVFILSVAVFMLPYAAGPGALGWISWDVVNGFRLFGGGMFVATGLIMMIRD